MQEPAVQKPDCMIQQLWIVQIYMSKARRRFTDLVANQHDLLDVEADCPDPLGDI
jgi:hypothetical protein